MTQLLDQITPLVILMALVIVVYLGGCAFALYTQAIDFKEFAAAVGVLLGWVGGMGTRIAFPQNPPTND